MKLLKNSEKGSIVVTIIVLALLGLFLLLSIPTFIYVYIAQPHKIAGSAMFPTLKDGNYILTDKITYKNQNPKRGEIIVFRARSEEIDFIKRIIGLPGEEIMIKNNKVYINGKILSEPYLEAGTKTLPATFMKEGQVVKIPEGSYIVMGDNRIASSDSREWGFMSEELIVGKYFFKYSE